MHRMRVRPENAQRNNGRPTQNRDQPSTTRDN